jgi:hypothetical protein
MQEPCSSTACTVAPQRCNDCTAAPLRVQQSSFHLGRHSPDRSNSASRRSTGSPRVVLSLCRIDGRRRTNLDGHAKESLALTPAAGTTRCERINARANPGGQEAAGSTGSRKPPGQLRKWPTPARLARSAIGALSNQFWATCRARYACPQPHSIAGCGGRARPVQDRGLRGHGARLHSRRPENGRCAGRSSGRRPLATGPAAIRLLR